MTHATRHAAARATLHRRKAAAAILTVALASFGLAVSSRSFAQDMSSPAPETQQAPAPGLTPATADGKPTVARLSRTTPLDRRMSVLTKELNLDTKQQVQIRRILEAQRAAVRAIWSDPSILPPERSAATQAQTEHTGDAIRAVLNDEQQKLYNRSRADNPMPPGDKRSVEQWMDAAKAKPPGNP
jgi:hypothetical protein